MSHDPGRKERLMAAIKEKAPLVHEFLTEDRFHTARTFATLALTLLVGAGLLWGLTGQSFGDAPVVVIESGSMMHCGPDSTSPTRGCTSTSFGRLDTIDPGDLVFVRATSGPGDVETFVEDGRNRFGEPGDVIIYDRGPGAPPIIHRAMFWIELHGDGTYSVEALGIDRSNDLDHPALTSTEARERFGLGGGCQLFDSRTRNGHGGSPGILETEASGWITKGDNLLTNPCWDQGGSIFALPIAPEDVLGKARGQVPWIGLLKLWVFDIFQGTGKYAAAPGDLRGLMWTSVAAVIVVPYGIEWIIKRRRDASDAKEKRPPDRW